MDEELKRVEDMTEVELDAELRKYGVDPQQLEGKMLQKLFECVGEQAARIEALKADRVASTEAMRKALEAIADNDGESCQRCEGNGRLWADGQAHPPAYDGLTRACPSCDGKGRTYLDVKEIARAALTARAAGQGTEEK